MTRRAPAGYILILAAVSLSACSSGKADEAQDSSTSVERAQPGGTTDDAASADPARTSSSGEVSGNTPNVPAPSAYASGRPGQPAIPETVEDPDWRSRYSTEVTYVNRSGRAIPATMGASPRTALVGTVPEGDGVAIITCELDSTFCKVRWGAEGKEGYVNMDLFTGTAN